MNIAKLSDLVGIINKIAPQALAAEWDNPGLQVGDPAATVERIMVALDPGPQAIETAIAAGCNLLLTHHPLIFKPLKRISSQEQTGALIIRAIGGRLAIASLHTNYDIAEDGVNDLLAVRLGLADSLPLSVTNAEELVKLAVFVPHGHEEQVLAALFRFAGQLGNYGDCSFRTSGTGTFRPLAGATPFIGKVGEREEVGESRIEVLLRRAELGAALKALAAAHPYEEPAYDLYPLLNQGRSRGLGRIGRLPAPLSLGDYAARVKERLGAKGVRVVGSLERRVEKVALCGGSGASLLRDAARQGADLLVTGDLKYHEAREAEALGIAIIDAGHFATEHPMVEGLAERLRQELARRSLQAEVCCCTTEVEPFTHC